MLHVHTAGADLAHTYVMVASVHVMAKSFLEQLRAKDSGGRLQRRTSLFVFGG